MNLQYKPAGEVKTGDLLLSPRDGTRLRVTSTERRGRWVELNVALAPRGPVRTATVDACTMLALLTPTCPGCGSGDVRLFGACSWDCLLEGVEWADLGWYDDGEEECHSDGVAVGRD